MGAIESYQSGDPIKKWTKVLNRHFSKEEKPMKGRPTSLAIRDTQIKTMVRYDFPPTRMAVLKRIANECWLGRMRMEAWNSPPLLEKKQNGSALENGPAVPEKLNIKSPHDPAILLLEIYSRRTENTCPHENLNGNIYSNIICKSQDVQTTQMPTDWRMNKQKAIGLYDIYYLAIKRNEVPIDGTIQMNCKHAQ